MINAIIKGLFWLVTRIFTLIMAPLILTITALFPNLSQTILNINSFLTSGLLYVRSILHLFLIPDSLMILFFNFFIVLNTMFFACITVFFCINVYNKFKL